MSKTPLIRRAPLSGAYFVITNYTEHGAGRIVANVKHDVTDQVEAIVAERLAERTSVLQAVVEQHLATNEALAGRIAAVREVCERLINLRILSMVTPAMEVLAALDGTTPRVDGGMTAVWLTPEDLEIIRELLENTPVARQDGADAALARIIDALGTTPQAEPEPEPEPEPPAEPTDGIDLMAALNRALRRAKAARKAVQADAQDGGQS